MAVYEIEPFNIALCVCSRPQMYTASGSLGEVLALFEGYDVASKLGASPKDNSPAQILCWIDELVDSECPFPKDRFVTLVSKFSTEAAALAAISTYAQTLNNIS